jgi:phenylacetate-CoA ligase
MNLINVARSKYRQWERQKAIKILTTTDPEKIVSYGEKLLIKAFHRAARRVPAYKDLLKKKGIDPSRVTDVETFKKLLPIITKEDIFPNYEIEDLCIDGRLDSMKNPMSSSGFSGLFSFGINTGENLLNAEKSIDTALDYTFHISRKKTFMINCVPMGVKIPTSLPVADCSVRSDMALAIYKKFAPKFEQTIFVSDPHFLKKLAEDGLDQGIDWKKENVHLISGEDWFSESFRNYLGSILGTDWSNTKRGFVGATMGIAELDLNLFHESPHTIQIRRAAQEDKNLRYALFGNEVEVCPILFHYYPHRIFLEALGEENEPSELVFSMLSESLLIPLMRYNSKDMGMIFSYDKIKGILSQSGFGHLCPELKLPIVAVGGRKGRCVTTDGISIYPEEVKQGLYCDFGVAAATTGYFRLRKDLNKILIEIQLRENINKTSELESSFQKAIAHYVRADFEIRLYPYRQFPYGIGVDYERKFKHVD